MAGVHEDFGEKIGGAKKDLWKDRGLYADDLEAMNEREAEKFVKKDNVWKKPDYAAMLEEGIPLGVVYFIKKARDGLNASPQYYRTDDTPEKRTARQKEYIKTVRELQTVLSDVRTVEDAIRAYDRFFADNGYLEKVQGWGSGIHYRATKKGQDNPVITNKLSNTMLIRSAEYFERNFAQKAKKEQFCVSKEQKIPKGYAIHFNDGKQTYSKNGDWKPGTYYVTKGYSILRTNFETKEAALKWVQELAKGRNKNGKIRFVPPQLAHVKRTGPDYRNGVEITGQHYLDTFGFRGGEFGNWMNQNDRQTSLNMGFEALKDLASALKISDKDIAYQGTLVECGKMLQRGTPKLDKDGKPMRNEKGKIIYEPYKIRVFNTINFQKSMHFNPFAYIHSEKDILKIVTTLIANTKGEGKAGDDFWVKAETLLYTALIGYIYYEAPVNEQNFATLVEMLNAMEVREDDESFKNAVDLLFDALEQKDPDHFALRQYKKYKLAAGKTAKSILISCASRLAPFDIKEVREITMYDELDLDMLGDERTALFLIMSDTDGTFAFLISLIYSILFNRLCERADDVYGGRLPIHVRCLIDEAANIGQIPNLERLMATIRSREISACLVLQAQSQLKALYKDNMDTIIGNCDASLFLGGKEETTLKSWNSLLGKETIDLYNTSVTKGNQESHGQNFQKLGKDLMSVDELAVMDGGKCLLQIRGVRPFLSRKYDITKHPNYKLLSDFNEKNAFNIEKFLSTRMPMRPGERYRNYEVTAEDLASQTL